jgi:hypothetical protein
LIFKLLLLFAFVGFLAAVVAAVVAVIWLFKKFLAKRTNGGSAK